MASKYGHVKTFSASLGSGFVELGGEAYPFDASALPEDAETVRSGDRVTVDFEGDAVRAVELVDGPGNRATVGEELHPGEGTSRVTLRASGQTPARFTLDNFKKKASRLDFFG
jgi:hypothetical protein